MKPSKVKEDIQNFITITKYKNGKIKITQELSNESNLYKLLKTKGFGRTELNDKWIYFRRIEDDIKCVQKIDLIDMITEFFRLGEYENLPIGVEKEDILEWYYSEGPIVRENGLLKNHLNDELSREEEDKLRMDTDYSFRKSELIKS